MPVPSPGHDGIGSQPVFAAILILGLAEWQNDRNLSKLIQFGLECMGRLPFVIVGEGTELAIARCLWNSYKAKLKSDSQRSHMVTCH